MTQYYRRQIDAAKRTLHRKRDDALEMVNWLEKLSGARQGLWVS